MIPRLNQTCTISSISINEYGDKTKATLSSGVKCRFFESSGKIKDPKGEYIQYDAYCHLPPDTIVQKGQLLTINSKDYQIEYAGHTRDLNGDVFFQFVTLNQVYATA